MIIDEICDRLVVKGVGAMNLTIFTGSRANIPTGSGPYLSVVSTGGTGSSKTHNNTATQRPTLSLTSRASAPLLAYALARAAYDALGGENGLHNITLSGVFYLRIVARQEPTDIGADSSGRTMWVFNIDVEKEPS
jgi:hypothetical protein